LGGGEQTAVIATTTPTRIVIPATATRPPAATATRVVSNLPTPVLATGERQVLVEVDDDKNVTLTTYEGGKAPIVQTGAWELDAAQKQLTLTFTTLNGKPFKDVIIFKIENGELVPVSFNRALHGNISNIQFKRTGNAPSSFLLPLFGRSAGVSMPAAQATATPNPVSGDYGGTIPAPGPGEHLVVLTLNADGSAVLATTETGKSSTLQLGTWKADGNTVTVTLTDKDGTPLQDTLVFDLKGDELVGTSFDKALHGDSLALKRDPNSPVSPNAPAAGTYSQNLAAPGTATPIPITATPIAITATPTTQDTNLPDTGLGEDLLLLFGGGLLLLGIIIVVRRMRSA
jgi:LPXTG-motif cell wall-anchored protein